MKEKKKTSFPMKWSLVRIVILGILCIAFLKANAKDVPPKPNPPRLVNDYANLLTPQQQQALEQKLVSFDDTTGNQIAIVIENSLEGDAVERYTQELAEKWGIGRKGSNNGVLVYVAVKDHQMRIEVGYGLEPVITDMASFSINNDVLKPYFRQNQYYEGLDSATNILMALAGREFTSEQWLKDHSKSVNKQPTKSPVNPLVIIIMIIIFIIIFTRSGRGGRSGCLPLLLLGGLGGRRGGGFGGGGFGGGFGGGGGGGGFGGFGGGGFGGGGSSGSW
jgi:uncharacterized protein